MRTEAERIAVVRKWFDLKDSVKMPLPRADPALVPRTGQIMVIAGPSGSGKSSLLRALREKFGREWIDVLAIDPPRRRLVNIFDDRSVRATLDRLARVGLAEAHLLLCVPDQLSDGQRFRLRLALALQRAEQAARPATLICDEFAAPLDDLTAVVVCAALRRIIRGGLLGAIVATGREQLIHPLGADLVVHCDFGSVTEEPEAEPRICTNEHERKKGVSRPGLDS